MSHWKKWLKGWEDINKEDKIRKLLILVSLILLFFCLCGPKQEKVEKIIEDGVEVIVNHIEP